MQQHVQTFTASNAFSNDEQQVPPQGYLCTSSIQPYTTEDDQFIRQLKMYYERELGQYHDSAALTKEHEQHMKELNRLKAAFCVGEEHFLFAQVELHKTKSALEKVKNQAAWKDNYEQLPIATISYVGCVLCDF